MIVEIVVLLFLVGFLYWLGGLLMPEHKSIEQELIKGNLVICIVEKAEEE